MMDGMRGPKRLNRIRTSDAGGVAFLLPLICTVAVLFAAGCAEENWNLVNPPAGGDSILVRFLNMSGDGRSRALVLDGTRRSEDTPDASASACLLAPADSAFVSVAEQDTIVYSISGRVRFSKMSTELIIAVPSLPSSQQPRSIDTLLHFTTSRALLPQAGYGQVRLIVANDDPTASYALREGCPNGTMIGSPVSARQANGYTPVPAGSFVFSLSRGSVLVGTYVVAIRSRGSHTIVVSKRKNEAPDVRTVDEDNTTATAMAASVPVPGADRVSLVRVINARERSVDSISANGTGVVATSLAARRIGAYVPVLACAGSTSDEFRLFENGSETVTARTSLGVSSRYTIIAYDSSLTRSAPGMVLVPPTRTMTPKDSVTIRVVHCAPGAGMLRVRMGARTDDAGRFHNGEAVAQDLQLGSVSAPVRLPPGVAPMTFLSMATGQPDILRSTALSRFAAGKEYLLVCSPGSAINAIHVSVVENDVVQTSLDVVPAGVFTQLVQARSDRASLTVSVGGVVQSTGLTFGNALATVVPHGTGSVSFGGVTKQVTADSARRLTLVVTGENSSLTMVTLDEVSMKPSPDTARSRYLNVTKDVPRLRVSIDSVTNLGYNVYADDMEFGKPSAVRTEVKPRRINFVCGNAETLKEIFRPTYSVTLLAGKAYTVIVCGSAANGYSIIIQQEY